MAVVKKEELIERVGKIVGTDDDSFRLLEDLSDTLTAITETESENWKQKYEENDRNWREKYKERFMRGEEKAKVEIEVEEDKPLSYEELFKEE